MPRLAAARPQMGYGGMPGAEQQRLGRMGSRSAHGSDRLRSAHLGAHGAHGAPVSGGERNSEPWLLTMAASHIAAAITTASTCWRPPSGSRRSRTARYPLRKRRCQTSVPAGRPSGSASSSSVVLINSRYSSPLMNVMRSNPYVRSLFTYSSE